MRTFGRPHIGGSIAVLVFTLFLSLAPATCWIINIVQLAKCDWSSSGSWKGEIIHGIGVVPGAALVTVWFNDK